ncbi:mCG144480, partial [Mus musculus]
TTAVVHTTCSTVIQVDRSTCLLPSGPAQLLDMSAEDPNSACFLIQPRTTHSHIGLTTHNGLHPDPSIMNLKKMLHRHAHRSI